MSDSFELGDGNVTINGNNRNGNSEQQQQQRPSMKRAEQCSLSTLYSPLS
jgi:hypothetical protein